MFLTKLLEVAKSLNKQLNLETIRDIEKEFKWLNEEQLNKLCHELKYQGKLPSLQIFRELSGKYKIQRFTNDEPLHIWCPNCNMGIAAKVFTGSINCTGVFYNKCNRVYTYNDMLQIDRQLIKRS